LPRPPDQPLSEPARLLGLAKEAFAEGAYGLAERRYRQATDAAPDEALAHFLLAQAQFAQGKYQEAVASIQAGLRRQPNWPRTPFRPRDLYGAEAPDFPEHLRRLTDALPRHPQDPVLLFLLAYQLWFDGQQAEARKLFERAAAVTPDKTFIDRFQQLPGDPAK
jgi:tetratricopeptide (TPR) repeat protein